MGGFSSHYSERLWRRREGDIMRDAQRKETLLINPFRWRNEKVVIIAGDLVVVIIRAPSRLPALPNRLLLLLLLLLQMVPITRHANEKKVAMAHQRDCLEEDASVEDESLLLSNLIWPGTPERARRIVNSPGGGGGGGGRRGKVMIICLFRFLPRPPPPPPPPPPPLGRKHTYIHTVTLRAHPPLFPPICQTHMRLMEVV